MYKHLTPQEIEEFEKAFKMGGDFVDIYGDIRQSVAPESVLSFIDTLIGKRERDLLERYTEYLATDPTVVDRFMFSDSPKRNEEHDHPSQ